MTRNSTRVADDILAGINSARRGKDRVALPQHGITLDYDGGIRASCHFCRVSWNVPRSSHKQPQWWQCPNGCHHPTKK